MLTCCTKPQMLPANLLTALHRLTQLYVSVNRLANLSTEALGSSATKARAALRVDVHNLIPDDSEEHRVGTPLSAFGTFMYGIADTFGAASFGLPDSFSSTLREAASAPSSVRYKRDAHDRISVAHRCIVLASAHRRRPAAVRSPAYTSRALNPCRRRNPGLHVRSRHSPGPRTDQRPDEALFAVFGRAYVLINESLHDDHPRA